MNEPGIILNKVDVGAVTFK